MAANILSKNVISVLGGRGYGLLQNSGSWVNKYSTTYSTKVVVADDGRTLVCWHPEPEFPYEHSLPLPPEKEANTNVLKSMNDNDVRNFSHLEGMKEELARQQLMKFTFTTKHRWFPRLQKRRAKKTAMDRPYL